MKSHGGIPGQNISVPTQISMADNGNNKNSNPDPRDEHNKSKNQRGPARKETYKRVGDVVVPLPENQPENSTEDNLDQHHHVQENDPDPQTEESDGNPDEYYDPNDNPNDEPHEEAFDETGDTPDETAVPVDYLPHLKVPKKRKPTSVGSIFRKMFTRTAGKKKNCRKEAEESFADDVDQTLQDALAKEQEEAQRSIEAKEEKRRKKAEQKEKEALEKQARDLAAKATRKPNKLYNFLIYHDFFTKTGHVIIFVGSYVQCIGFWVENQIKSKSNQIICGFGFGF